MIKFINLKTGTFYDGAQPYIHWFEGQQSTGIIYSLPICFITDESHVRVELDSEIFSLVNPHITSSETVNGFEYKNINDLKVKYLDSKDSDNPHNLLLSNKYNNYNIYLIYIIGSSSIGAEYVDEFKINDISYNIGADFYQENESLYINASNFGINIPESIQKAIYSSNIHEEKKDNILLNRKFKELLSNYWDVIANKGSYKSLINSLKWFEWDDLVRVRELWKHEDFGKTIYDDRALCSILEDKYKDTLTCFAKTTYIALYNSMQHEAGDEYDSEKNPELEFIVSTWSKDELALKMCLLGNFYETYFMPIHLDLIHSTIEDIVFTNTLKIINNGIINRTDYIYDINDFKCIVNNNKPIVISNISVSADSTTLFNNGELFGVKLLSDIKGINESNLNNFWNQYYNGPGAIVKFECEIPVIDDDFVKKEIVKFNNKTVEDHKIFHGTESLVKLDFNIFIDQPGSYELELSFETAGGKKYIKPIQFEVIDITSTTLNIYRITRKKTPLTDNDLESTPDLKPMFGRNLKHSTSSEDSLSLNMYKQYIPIDNHDGDIGLNHILVINDEYDILTHNNKDWKFISNNLNIFITSTTEDSIYVKRQNKYVSTSWEVVLYKADSIKSNSKYILEYDIETDVNLKIINHICNSNGDKDSFMYDDSKNIKTITPGTTHIRNFIDTNSVKFEEQYIYISPTIQYLNKFGFLKISNIKFKLLPNDYFWVTKKGEDYHYDIGISKRFMTNIPVYDYIDEKYIYRSELGFFPEFHELIPFGSDNEELIEDYIIKNGELLCVIPTINSKDSIINFDWAKNIKNSSWVYKNTSTEEIFEYGDISTPIITGNYTTLSNGYYDIIFNYTLIGEEYKHTLTLNSAFIKK